MKKLGSQAVQEPMYIDLSTYTEPVPAPDLSY